MSARFLEAICGFDQVVPEIGKKKSPCPMMVSDTSDDPGDSPVMIVMRPRVSCGCELC